MFEALVKEARSEQELYDSLYKTVSRNMVLISPTQMLRRAAKLSPQTVALIFQDHHITYQQLFFRASALTRKIKEHIRPGDRVLVSFENSPEFYVAYFAAWQAGAVVVPLNVFLKEREIAHILEDAQPALILTHSDRVGLFEGAGVALPPIFTQHEMKTAVTEADALREEEIVNRAPDELAALLYTSGTTGTPKGVMLSSANIITNVLQVIARIKLTENERVFAVLPLFHAFAQCACIWGAVFACATVILVARIDRRQIIKALENKPTVFLGVPALYGLMIMLRTAPLDSIKFFASGGDALPDKIRMGFELLYRRKICSGYGMTEASPVISWDLKDELEPTDTAGKPLIGIEISIRNEKGNEVQKGDIGEIWVKGDNVMMGYYNAPEVTEEVLKHGWLNTGDLGYLNSDGCIVITGRLKDLIKNKGFNIYPQEVENVITMHANVLRVGVIGVPDEAEGEIPVAYVQLRKEDAQAPQELEALCKRQLAAYKVPKAFYCSVDELPLTVTGKVDKKVLRTWQK